VFIERAEGAERLKTFSYAGVRAHAALLVILSSIALHAALLYTLGRSYARIFEARALLKIFFAVAHAASIFESNFASPRDHLRLAGERLDTYGGAVISFSRLWNDFGCA
jgi:hypothetical protein